MTIIDLLAILRQHGAQPGEQRKQVEDFLANRDGRLSPAEFGEFLHFLEQEDNDQLSEIISHLLSNILVPPVECLDQILRLLCHPHRSVRNNIASIVYGFCYLSPEIVMRHVDLIIQLSLDSDSDYSIELVRSSIELYKHKLVSAIPASPASQMNECVYITHVFGSFIEIMSEIQSMKGGPEIGRRRVAIVLCCFIEVFQDYLTSLVCSNPDMAEPIIRLGFKSQLLSSDVITQLIAGLDERLGDSIAIYLYSMRGILLGSISNAGTITLQEDYETSKGLAKRLLRLVNGICPACGK